MAISKVKRSSTFVRIIMWTLLVIAAFLAVVLLVQQLRIMDMRKYIPNRLDVVLPPPNWESMEILDQDRLTRMMDANDQRAEELDVLSAQLANDSMRLEEQRQQVEKERNSVEEEKKRLNEGEKLYDKKKETIVQTAHELMQMDENIAVQILEKRDNQDIIWIMRVTDELSEEDGMLSVVPVWLELMDPSRAAEIQRERDLIPERQE